MTLALALTCREILGLLRALLHERSHDKVLGCINRIYSLLPAPMSRRKLSKYWNCSNPKANTADKEPYFDSRFHNPGYTPTKTHDLRNSHLILQYSRPLVGAGERL